MPQLRPGVVALTQSESWPIQYHLHKLAKQRGMILLANFE